ncbi:MAG: hypothetical protein MR343_03130 [Clostridia bacterium]|nr:hypothetical protein [Clostridia bacterium]
MKKEKGGGRNGSVAQGSDSRCLLLFGAGAWSGEPHHCQEAGSHLGERTKAVGATGALRKVQIPVACSFLEQVHGAEKCTTAPFLLQSPAYFSLLIFAA